MCTFQLFEVDFRNIRLFNDAVFIDEGSNSSTYFTLTHCGQNFSKSTETFIHLKFLEVQLATLYG